MKKRRTLLVPVVAMAYNAAGLILGKVAICLEAGAGGHLWAPGPVQIPIVRGGVVSRCAGYLPQFDYEATFPFPFSLRPVRVKKGDTITLEFRKGQPAIRIQ